jgi:hypothetical protein
MTFEVPVAAVERSRSRRGVAAVLAASCLIVMTAALAGLWRSAPTRSAGGGERLGAADGPVRSSELAVAPARAGFEAASHRIRSLPASLECHDVDARQCRRIVAAALAALPADLPEVRAAEAWRSLVCGDDFDCPPSYLADSVPAGSVIVRFADDSPSAALNVVDWSYGPSIRLGLRAWITRSVPAG